MHFGCIFPIPKDFLDKKRKMKMIRGFIAVTSE